LDLSRGWIAVGKKINRSFRALRNVRADRIIALSQHPSQQGSAGADSGAFCPPGGQNRAFGCRDGSQFLLRDSAVGGIITESEQ